MGRVRAFWNHGLLIPATPGYVVCIREVLRETLCGVAIPTELKRTYAVRLQACVRLINASVACVPLPPPPIAGGKCCCAIFLEAEDHLHRR